MTDSEKITILGGGNIGTAIAKGLVVSGRYRPEQITITRRKIKILNYLKNQGYNITDDNIESIKNSDIILISVLPQQLKELLSQIKNDLDPEKHILVSIVSGVSTEEIIKLIGKEIQVIRVMPTIAITIQESMTCIASENASKEKIQYIKNIFDNVGKTIIIREDQMIPATALCACGVAFFLRSVRAASQGGIEIGFHPSEALPMAAQTAKGAASLLLTMENHPEMEIDKVTTPEGCTISGLNMMEHQGFSSAMIKGITTSAEKAEKLYKKEQE